MKFYVFLALIVLFGCQQTPEQTIAKNNTEQMVKNKLPCQQSTTPLIKNTAKLKAMLIANGKIDAALSDEEIERAVKAYIRKKNSAFKKNCQK